MAISINGDATIKQPTSLKEETIQRVTDKTAIKGTSRRIWMSQKKQVTLVFNPLTQAQVNQILNTFYGGAASVVYNNTSTSFTFTGFATATEDEYMQGVSFLKSITVVIGEI